MKAGLFDPGHGGAEPGAVGIDGLREAEVVLEIAKLAAMRVRSAGISVTMSRTYDTSLSPADRSVMLLQSDHLFSVSIHCDAYGTSGSPATRGHTCYGSAYLPESYALAEAISVQLTARSQIPPVVLNPVRTKLNSTGDADFYYFIRDPTSVGVPSALVEVGFITNRDDANYLVTFWGRFTIGFAIGQGILDWLGVTDQLEELAIKLSEANLEIAEKDSILQEILKLIQEGR